MKIVVIGGTGLIGSKVVQNLKQRDQEAVPAAPNTGVDTLTGKELGEALAAPNRRDVSNSPSFEDRAAMDFFQTSGENIDRGREERLMRHHIALSVVGTDRLQDSGYFRAKLAQERLIEASPIPYTLIHATQFFEFIRSIADVSTIGGTVRVPPVKFQPMAAEDVATALTDAALSNPLNRMIEVGGPEVFAFDDAVRKVLQFDRDARNVIVDPGAPYYGVHLDESTLVPGPDARLGSTTLDWWLVNVAPPPRRAKAPAPEPTH